MKVRDLIIRLLENDLDADVVIETRANTPNKVITVWRDIRSVLNGDNQDSEVTILLDYIHKLTDDRVHVIDRPLRDEKSICYNCVFNYMHEKCMYTDIERDLNNIRGCSTKISARMLKDSGLTDDEFRTLVEAFKYFKNAFSVHIWAFLKNNLIKAETDMVKSHFLDIFYVPFGDIFLEMLHITYGYF